MKLPDPELPSVAEAVACAGGGGEASGDEDCLAAGVVAAALVGAEVDGAGAEAVDSADAEPAEADPEAAVGDVVPDPPQAVRPKPAMMTAMIATGTRRILMLLPSRE